MQLSERVKNLKPSPTLALVAQANALKAEGHDVISLSVGEPDWDTFDIAKDAAIAAIRAGRTKYTPADGMLSLRKSIAEACFLETGLQYKPNEVTITSGAKFILTVAIQVLVNPGDEVIIPAPYWVSYPTMVELANGVSKIVETNEATNFKMTAEQLSKAITAKTKVLMLNSPSNPTGLVYTEKELSDIADVLRKHPNIVVISDDIYNRLVFSGGKIAPHLLKVAPDLRDRVLCVNGVSKSYSMTGWRIGWAVGPEAIVKGMSNYQSQALGCASSVSQEASQAAILGSDEKLVEVCHVLAERADYAIAKLNTIEGIDVFKPQGAFYLWVGIKSYFGKTLSGHSIAGSKDFCRALLEEKHVVVVPGDEFGTEGYMRMSFALSKERMAEALDRLQSFVNSV